MKFTSGPQHKIPGNFEMLFDANVYDDHLIAVHNTTVDKLLETMKLDAIPAPSVALTKNSIGHSEFGEISLVLGSNSITPSEANHIYDCDAWTPEFPQIDTKINSDAALAIYDKFKELSPKIPASMSDMMRFHPSNIESDISNHGMRQFLDNLANNYVIKALFLADNGVFTQDSTHLENSVGNDKVPLIKTLEASLSDDDRQALMDAFTTDSAISDNLKNLIVKTDADLGTNAIDGTSSFKMRMQTRNIARQLHDYISNNNTFSQNVILDIAATQSNIDALISDKSADFKQWLSETFDHIVETSGIRNDLDIIDSSGNRRSFEQLHEPVNCENILKYMLKDGLTNIQNTFLGDGPLTISDLRCFVAKDFESLSDVTANSSKLELLDKDVFAERDNKVNESLTSVLNSILESSSKEFPDSSIPICELSGDIRQIFRKTSDPDVIMSELNELGYDASASDIGTILSLCNEVRDMSVPYFEAKLFRPVEFSEFTAVVPDSTPESVISKMKDVGFADVKTYSAGDENDRLRVVNMVSTNVYHNDVELSCNAPVVEPVQEITDTIERESLSPKQASFFKDSQLRDGRGDMIHCYHTTVHKFDAFDKSTIGNQSGDNGYFGEGFYFTAQPGFNSCCWPDKEKGEELIKLDCYINMKNPMYMECFGKPDYTSNDPYKYDAERLLTYIKNHVDVNAAHDNGLDIVCSEEDFVAYLKDEHLYDGEYKELIESYENGDIQFYDEIDGVTLDSLYYDAQRDGSIATPDNLTFDKLHRGLLAGYSRQITEFAKANGYDGIISDGKPGSLSQPTEIVVFEPNQIKLASNLNPTNSPSMSDKHTPTKKIDLDMSH